MYLFFSPKLLHPIFIVLGIYTHKSYISTPNEYIVFFRAPKKNGRLCFMLLLACTYLEPFSLCSLLMEKCRVGQRTTSQMVVFVSAALNPEGIKI